MVHVALATCAKPAERDADEEDLVAALQARGVRVRLLAWDDPGQTSAPSKAGELVVLRSTWNYYRHVDAFLAWVERSERLLNPARIVRENARKTYLRDLERSGIAVVPTEYVNKGDTCSASRLMRDRWSAIVIKPVVSAGSFRTRVFTEDQAEAAQLFLDELTAERDAMIQRWMPSVETYGERCLVWIDGELTHSIRKSPRFAGAEESVSAAQPIAPDERAFAERILAPFANDLLYARVDVVRDEDTLRLMELELIEPSLFLRQHPPALDRFADAIVRHAKKD